MIHLPADPIGWKGRSALSIVVNEVNREDAFSNSAVSSQIMPPCSPLHWAIRSNNVSAVRLLLQNEADVNQVDSSARTPLYLALSSQQPAELIRHLLHHFVCLSEPVHCGIDDVLLAVGRGDLEVLKMLAEANPEIMKAAERFSPGDVLYHARSVDIFQYLVSHGMSYSVVQSFVTSPISIKINEPLCSAFIFNSGLASQLTRESAANAFAIAARDGNLLVIKRLRHILSSGLFATFLNQTNCGWASPLCLASSKNAAKLAQGLIFMGAEVDLEGCPYGSPLMAACAWGSLDVVRCLVRSRASLCYVTEDGLLRSAVGLSSRHQKVKRWLLVDRHVEQRKLQYQSEPSGSLQSGWVGPMFFKLALPAYMHRDFGESRWSHLRRVQKWKADLLGSTLAESRNNSGLDFNAQFEAESKERDARVAHRQFVERLG